MALPAIAPDMTRRGPLAGLRVVELAGMGPAPFACMVLADLGADVVRVDRPPTDHGSVADTNPTDVMARGKRSVCIDLKMPEGVELVLTMVERADVVVEGFRPGVVERLGLGPEVIAERNPRAIFGRMTGWGQAGPLSAAAGHDINYIALAGVLHPMGRSDQPPPPPLNLVGDFGGGGMVLAVGIMCALFERTTSGRGQVIDAAMVDGAALLSTVLYGLRAEGSWLDRRWANALDGGAPWYNTYRTKDGGFVSVGSIEPQFYAQLVKLVGAEDIGVDAQYDRAAWLPMQERFARIFAEKTRSEWCELLEGTDACFAPVLSLGEAAAHPHLQHRETFIDVAGITQPAPAPRFSRTPAALPAPPPAPGAHTRQILASWEVCSDEETTRLQACGALR